MAPPTSTIRSEEHTSELQSLRHLVCRLLLEKKKKKTTNTRREAIMSTVRRHAKCTWHVPTPNTISSDDHLVPHYVRFLFLFFFFFLNDTAPPEIYPLPLHDALPIYQLVAIPANKHGVQDRFLNLHGRLGLIKLPKLRLAAADAEQIGRASCRGR